ncbi:type II toxin-antitoxin system VapC family toxin [Methanocaldococcus sp.]|uniref:type II toxin-antitoxin system VapC family toxin n=1 Tax=Methanocaldococcus sp. TaxID=2152917 RepID=UPI00261B4517|nr:type II toxin-antitoxin system VapC family toxin [Methanocaldococcus sp.]MCQ6254552.1 PIN domain-containing protein [Methanocaldococcus sp.]
MNLSNIFIDSSVMVGLFVGDVKAHKLLSKLINEDYILCINPIVFSETMFKVTFHIALEDGIKGVYDLKKNLNKYSWVYDEVKENIDKMINRGYLKILDTNWDVLKLSSEIGRKYNLLTNDAIIVATCKYYDIDKLATFDSDFDKVDFIKIIKE